MGHCLKLAGDKLKKKKKNLKFLLEREPPKADDKRN